MTNLTNQSATEWRCLRLQAVSDLTGLGKSTIWQWCREGRFPKPQKLAGKVTVWNAADVQAWLASKAEGRSHAA